MHGNMQRVEEHAGDRGNVSGNGDSARGAVLCCWCHAAASFLHVGCKIKPCMLESVQFGRTAGDDGLMVEGGSRLTLGD